ncbi:MAG TPA: DUF6502 family protein [Patescibacteria group bacterium]|nr:DUF6502 family protein [Patescibacteria group bacterium]
MTNPLNNTQNPMPISESNSLLLQAVRKLMRPLARLFIGKGLPLQVFIEIMKDVYVEIAEENLAAANIRPTDSQISLMTGVHRRDVRKFRSRANDEPLDVPYVSVGAELVAIWMGNPEFLNPQGLPRPLPYVNRENPKLSFSALAETVSRDVRPRAILDEMLRQDIARYDEITDNVWLNVEAFVPQEGWAEKLYYFGHNGQDHLEAAVTNILSPKPPFLDRSVYYNGLTKESAEALQNMARDAAMKALRGLNRKALEMHDIDKGEPDATYRINFGAYFFTDADLTRKEKG